MVYLSGVRGSAILALLLSSVISAPVQDAADVVPRTILTREELDLLGLITEAPPFKGTAALGKRDLFERDDDRVLWESKAYPYSAMGRLVHTKKDGTGYTASGVLVGERLVLTAKHAVPTGLGTTIRFSPAYDAKDVYPGANVIQTLHYTDTQEHKWCEYKEDWAIYVLDQPLGKERGYLGVRLFDDSVAKAKFYHLGYPGDKNGKATRQDNITVESSTNCDKYGPLDTDADGTYGQSGGPLWLRHGNGDRYVYGVASVANAKEPYDMIVFASGERMVNAVVKARTDFK